MEHILFDTCTFHIMEPPLTRDGRKYYAQLVIGKTFSVTVADGHQNLQVNLKF